MPTSTHSLKQQRGSNAICRRKSTKHVGVVAAVVPFKIIRQYHSSNEKNALSLRCPTRTISLPHPICQKSRSRHVEPSPQTSAGTIVLPTHAMRLNHPTNRNPVLPLHEYGLDTATTCCWLPVRFSPPSKTPPLIP